MSTATRSGAHDALLADQLAGDPAGAVEAVLVEAVLDWGVPRLRDLPWRHSRDPWQILVSEVMLQQTQASRVEQRWRAFLDRFPTPAACARASLGDVLREWSGLGYPRRARNLHLSAQRITEAGEFPRTLEGLLALPGVGPYTARALQAFAFEDDAAVVDTNIARVLARWSGVRHTPRSVQALADTFVPTGRSWAWNQCLMDLGATVCRPSRPGCTTCPLAATCAWSCHGGADPSVGSAGVSTRQASFAGSDREARGRLLRALTSAPCELSEVPTTMGRTSERAGALLAGLVAEGLCVVNGSRVELPGRPAETSPDPS